MTAALELTTREADRFWSKVSRRPNACWEWLGAKTPRGYGKLFLRGRVEYAHRISYSMHYGEIPAGMFVCHHCDNPPCPNPDHLFVGDASANILDMIAKGRNRNAQLSKPESFRRGDLHEWSKLTEVSVREILATYRAGVAGFGCVSLSRRYGVTPAAILRITRGLSWAHIERPTHLPQPKSEAARILTERIAARVAADSMEERIAGRIE